MYRATPRFDAPARRRLASSALGYSDRSAWHRHRRPSTCAATWRWCTSRTARACVGVQLHRTGRATWSHGF